MRLKMISAPVYVVLITICLNAKASDELRHNPFERPEMKSEQKQADTVRTRAMKLRGTVIDGHDSMVNIDGRFYRFNQEVAGYRVVGIARKSVTLRRGDSEMILLLNEDE